MAIQDESTGGGQHQQQVQDSLRFMVAEDSRAINFCDSSHLNDMPPSAVERAYTPPVEEHDGNPSENPETHFIEEYPPEHFAGASYETCRTYFDLIGDKQAESGGGMWGPFKDAEKWELAKWLVQNIGHNQTEDFLQLSIVRKLEVVSDQCKICTYCVTVSMNRSKTA